jgi:hypothetical protein
MCVPSSLLFQRGGESRVLRLVSLYKKFPYLFLIIPVFPLALFEMFMDPAAAGVRFAGGWNIFTYLLYFVYEFAIFSSPSKDHLTRYKFHILWIAILISAAYLIFTTLMPDPHYGSTLIKYFVILPTSFAGIMMVYHFIIRPLKVLRFFFGMK